MSVDDFRDEIGQRLPVDVIVTVIGGEQSAAAILAGGGLVGTRSSATPPDGVPIEFVDWPFQLEDPSVEAHVDAVADHEPRYAVAPDAEPGRSLDTTLDVAERLEPHAEHVLVVPKDVPPAAIPDRYRVAVPFRDGFDTDLVRNTFPDFRGRPVHLLGGSPTDHFRLVGRHELDVRSVDTPKVLAWADFGRVWVAGKRSADDVEDLDLPELLVEREAAFALGERVMDLRPDDLLESRAARITFSVRNIRQAWRERRVSAIRAVEPGRGPPPVPPEGSGLLGPANTFEEREAMRERFFEATMEEDIGEVESEERVPSLGEFGNPD